MNIKNFLENIIEETDNFLEKDRNFNKTPD